MIFGIKLQIQLSEFLGGSMLILTLLWTVYQLSVNIIVSQTAFFLILFKAMFRRGGLELKPNYVEPTNKLLNIVSFF